EPAGAPPRVSPSTARLWMLLDATTVLASAAIAVWLELRAGSTAGAREFYRGTMFSDHFIGRQLAVLCGFILALIVTSRRLNLYSPARLQSFLHEQRLSVQACFTSGVLLLGTLYLVDDTEVPHGVVLITLALATVGLSLRRIFYRILLYRRFDRGIDTRNVLIVGTGPEAHALRRYLESVRHLGYKFKGFIGVTDEELRQDSGTLDVAGTVDTLFQHARKQFVDEIFITAPCDPVAMQEILEQARASRVNLRVVPNIYGGTAWNSPIEYIGQFPTIPLHSGRVPEVTRLIKRFFDVIFLMLMLVLLAPFFLLVAMVIKLDSSGPVFYAADRIGKKGRVFRCFKLRTMVDDAEDRRADILHMNERDGVLFKISNDPRITRVGRLLRKYSLDELPQFFNVLRGDMSVVGPRPPIASEVKEYKLGHLRRLDVTPGITGLWQVQARRDPSFDSYVSLDVAYIESWSMWLDFKIIVRTIGVVLAGTGT
ncbi:MAG: sugar transferase, partial [Acidobacteriota bacterium]|nr:sugar transferase [Acidobacteriota bacterium]